MAELVDAYASGAYESNLMGVRVSPRPRKVLLVFYLDMNNYKEYFKGKKITMLGLGLLGRGLNDAKFLAECGAELLVTDLKTRDELAPTIKQLSKYKNITYVLGEHRLEDFKNRDMIIKAAGVPLDSPYILEARKNNIPVEMDESLFCKLPSLFCHSRVDGNPGFEAPKMDPRIREDDKEGEKCGEKEIITIGITGTRGKTTTTYLIYQMLKDYFGDDKVHLGGNIKGLATLPLIKKVKPGDIVVMELSSWQLQGFGDAKISPDIAVFTNLLPDHLNYYMKVSKDEAEATQRYFTDKAQIFANQTKDDFLILEKDIKKIIGERYTGKIQSKIILPKISEVANWKPKLKGDHNLNHIMQALEVGKIFDIPENKIRRSLEGFAGVEGRLELIRNYKGINIYNDTTSTTPDALEVALKSLYGDLKGKGNIVLIAGGADKKLDMSGAVKNITKFASKVVLLSGTGTETIKSEILKNMKENAVECDSLKKAVDQAVKFAKRGDVILLSPGFASFGMFKNEFDRGEQFVKLIKRLK